MADEIFDGIQLRVNAATPDSWPSQWPRLTCRQANQLALEVSDLKLDANREIVFAGDGKFRSTGNLRFFTDSPSTTEKLSLLSNGNVGIGTTSPGHKLAIASGDINIDDGRALRQAGRWVIGGDSNVLGIGSSDVRDGRDIRFDPGFAGALTIKKDTGNVGIGTTSPHTKFEVYGGRLRVSTSDANSAGVIELSNGSKTNYVFTDGSTGHLFLRTDSPSHDIILQAGGSQGNVGIGTPPAYKLDVAGAAHASSFPTSSDSRLKTNVTPLTNVLEKLEKIRGISFEWNELYESLGRSTGHKEIGVTAQEVEAVFPELVTTWGDEGYKAVDYGRLTGVLIEAAKELKAENNLLKQRIEALERAIEKK